MNAHHEYDDDADVTTNGNKRDEYLRKASEKNKAAAINKANSKETMTNSCIVKSFGMQTQHPIVETTSRGTGTNFRMGTRNFGVQTEDVVITFHPASSPLQKLTSTGSLCDLSLFSDNNKVNKKM